jgi:hypothetical protein
MSRASEGHYKLGCAERASVARLLRLKDARDNDARFKSFNSQVDPSSW